MTDTREILKQDVVTKVEELVDTLWIISNPREGDYHDIAMAIDELETVRKRLVS